MKVPKMLKLIRDENGKLIVESLDGMKVVIEEFQNGFKFDGKWWPKEKAGSLLIAIKQELASQVFNS